MLGDTYQLVSYLDRNDREGAMQLISTYLAKLLLVSRWDPVKLKAHLRVLLSVMTSQELLRGVLGLGLTLAVHLGLRACFDLVPARGGWALGLRTLRYALVGFAGGWGAPWLFVQTGLAKREARSGTLPD